ncbi:MAG: hypothetical protein ACI8X5_003959 [Planctomycetota bacterium]|jgi:hypothetical protein
MIMNRARLIPALLLALVGSVLGGCSSTSYQLVPPPVDEQEAPAEDQCRVYIVRASNGWGKIREVEIIDRDTKIGSLGTNSYLCWDREPGRHSMQILFHGSVLTDGVMEGILWFEGEAAGTYYYEVNLRQSDRKPEAKLLKPEEGRAMVAERSAAEPR